MKVEAYICDFCNTLRIAEEIVGVSLQPDLFEPMKGFKTNFKPERENAHYCTQCYSNIVISVAERECNRKKDEHGYTLKLEELSYMLRSQVVTNYNKKVQKKLARKR